MNDRILVVVASVVLGLIAQPPVAARTGAAPANTTSLLASCCTEMRYRMIGPFRAGRTKAAAGIPGQPNVFYIGVNNGGVWKTTDYGRTWNPIFDDQPTGSIGAIAIAPSNTRVIYVGSGEGLQRPDLSTGDGIYKSTDGGATWTHLGLRDGQQIGADRRRSAKRESPVRRRTRSPVRCEQRAGSVSITDGGLTFSRVLYKDADTGACVVVIDPSNPDIVYADMW